MCFCDLSVDCTVNRNWQDLGRLVLDAKLFDYDENPSYYAYKRDNNANYLAVGGEMHETVTLNDLMATFPEFTQRTWGSQPHFQFGELTPTLMSLLTEWCATKCDNNPQCIGFEYVFNWDQTTTYCKLRSHETKMLKTGAYRHDNRHWFWTKTSQRRTDYYWFPSFNHTTEADRMWTNPSSKHGGSIDVCVNPPNEHSRAPVHARACIERAAATSRGKTRGNSSRNRDEKPFQAVATVFIV